MSFVIRCFAVIVAATLALPAHAATNWSAQDYDLYPGDFDGDGYTDLLYIAKDPSHPSGIVLSDGTGLNVTLQTWGNAYLGIPWNAGTYNVIVADFDGDKKADILLQSKTAGDSYLLLTEVGGVGAISQTIPYNGNGLLWAGDQHKIVAGDFNGDGRADLFFQALDPTGLNAVLVPDSSGYFTAAAPLQSWNDGYAGFNWALSESNIAAGDFNGDGFTDLLVQAQPISGGTPAQPAVYAPNSFGVVLAQAGAAPFLTSGVQAWSENGYSAHWSPLSQVVVVGDLNGDGRADVLLQARTTSDSSYTLYGRATGATFGAATAVSAGTIPSADMARVLAGHYASKGGQLYLQALTSTGANSLATVSDSKVTTSAGELPLTGASSLTLSQQPAQLAAAALAVTSAGRTPGQFAVSAMGAATYQIPIWTPPGARGIEPKLALVYSSGGPDGLMGPGWNLSGLSSITRCNKTYADNGAPAGVKLTTADDFCLDGNRLRLTAGTYGVAGSTYQTQISTFSNVTAYGAAGSGPSYFIVQGKDGLYYEYGNTADSKAYANLGSTPYAWMLNKVRDRETSPDNLIITYSTVSGSVQPASIQYTQTPSTTNGTTYPYTVSFTYQNRLKNLSKYVAGLNIQQTQVLSKINVQSSTTSVRQYNITYATAPTTQRDRVSTIQECAGSTGTDCLLQTTITYENGTAGVSAASTTLPFPAGLSGSAYWDFDGDGKADLLYNNAGTYFVMLSNASGYDPAISTGVTAPLAYGDVLGSGKDGIVADKAGALWYYTYNGSAFVGVSLGINTPTASSYKLVDIEGNGHPDLVTMNVLEVDVHRNTSAGSAASFDPTLIGAYTVTSPGGALRGTPVIFSNSDSLRAFDFDGDGRKDIAIRIRFDCGTVQEPDFCAREYELLSAGTTFTQGVGFAQSGGVVPVAAFTNWNSDACTDLILGDSSTTTSVYVSPCTGGAPIEILLPGSIQAVGTMDWNGDGQSDLLIVNGTTLGVYLSTGIGASALVSTTIPSAGATGYTMTDINGDGLEEVVSSNAATPIYYAHNGAGTPADLATTISDGWSISASPTYVSIAKSNYTRGTGAVFPESDITAPLYVVSQATQSDGIGGSYTNTFSYFTARVNRQGRGFEGFGKTRSADSRANSLVTDVLYNQNFPYTGTVSERDTYQNNGTSLLSKTVNVFSVTTLAGANCLPNTVAANMRCFPYLSKATTTSYEIGAASPYQTSVSDFTFDTNGNVLTSKVTTTDNDPASPNYNDVWQSLVTNVYGTTNATTWCFDKPTHTTTANSISGQVPAQPSLTRTVDHTIDTTHCRNATETVEPGGALQAATTFGYDGCGNVSSVSIVGKDEAGVAMTARTTTSSYGPRCTFPESVTNALGQIAYMTYDYRYGERATSKDPNGIQVSWVYDNFGRKTTETRPDNTSTGWVYEDCTTAACWGITDNLRFRVTETRYDSAGGYVTSALHYFDGLERLRYDSGYRVLGTLTYTKTTYDVFGRKVDNYLPYSSGSYGNGFHRLAYDILSRPTSDKLYDSSSVLDRTTTMSYAGLKTTITDPLSNATSKWTDVAGRLRRIIDPAPGGTTNHTYDVFGNLVYMSDATSKVTTFAYNLRGFKTSSVDPDTGTWTYTPDSLNELKVQVDAKSQQTKFGYDLLGRMISRLEPESTTATTWTYGTVATSHEIGHLKSVSKPDGYAESYTFDGLGRPASTTITEDASYAINYAYNTIGAVDTVTYPASTGTRFALKYVYSYGAVSQVKDNAAGTVFWSLASANDSALPTSEVLGNGVTVTSGYTPWTNDLVTRKEGTGGVVNSLQDLSYAWDDNGNLHQRQDLKQSLTEIFGHDTLNRLSSSTLNGVANLTVGYDAAGNITSKDDVGSYDYTTAQAGCTYQSYAQPHAVRKAGSAVYCYDANGNATQRGGGAIAYASYNLPTSIAYGSNATTFSYNADHQRWKQDANYAGTHEVSYYIGGLMEKVTRGSGPTEYRHLIPAGSSSVILTRRSDATTSTYYATSDHLGSGDLILSSTATVLARESFTPFGARRGSNWQGIPTTADYSAFSNTTRRGFTGHEMLDSVSLVHMNGRVYDPTLGRFLQADPIIQTIAISQALNPYSYVMNMPLTLTDPSGMSWLSKIVHSVGHFLHQYWKPLLAIAVAAVAWGYIGPLASQYFSAVTLPAGTITTAGGIVAGAAAGAISGGIMGGWKGALVGAASGAMFGGIQGYYGTTFNAGRALATGVAGGASSEIGGGKFGRGFELGLALYGIQWAAYSMRESMVQQSKQNPLNDGTEKSAGMYGDRFKLAGARFIEKMKGLFAAVSAPLGGEQDKAGTLFGFGYESGSWRDVLLESYAGPHDWLSSFAYNSAGNAMAWTGTALGEAAFTAYGAAAIIPASAFVGASVAPEIAYEN